MMDIPITEKRLYLRVIYQAVRDLYGIDPRHRDSAHRFLAGIDGALQDICQFIGTDPIMWVTEYHHDRCMRIYNIIRRGNYE